MREACFFGDVELLDAKWSLSDGRTVELRICGESFDRVHPFKVYQKRRNGRVGTRFHGHFASYETGEEVMMLECMLADWKDSSSVGQAFKFWLDHESTLHPFAGFKRRKASEPGDLFTLTLVEVDDDETNINAAQRARAESGQAAAAGDGGAQPGEPAGHHELPPVAGNRTGAHRQKQSAPRRMSSSVHLFATSALCVRWLTETKRQLVKEWTPEVARQYIKSVCKVESLSDLDRNPEAVKRYNEEIARPYDRWYRQEPHNGPDR